ncbi:hypothetical protein IAR50_005987 [Cryptococcus sp. DSM 104548]
MSLYKFLVGGYRSVYEIFSFEPSTSKIKLAGSSPALIKPTWLELPGAPINKSDSEKRYLYTVSDVDGGSAVSLKLEGDEIEITGQRQCHGGAVHVHVMKDGSGIILSNFIGGSAIFFPIDSNGALSKTSESPLLKLPFVYEGQTAPNPKRQDASHAHNVVEGVDGKLYLADLGTDRIWIVKREGESGLAIDGWLQAPPGSGPRHSLISEDGKFLYNITEVSNEILIFPLDSSAEHPEPLPSRVSVIPPSVPSDPAAQGHMNAAQLFFNPAHPGVLYASNRLELTLPAEFATGEEGDAVAIVKLSATGDELGEVKWVRTGCNNLRGMRVSPDGKYVVVAGRVAGGLEIWSTGQDGMSWKLAGKDESIDLVTDMTWL